MPLFKVRTIGTTKSGLLQAVICPRCREELKESDHLQTSGEGIGMRKVTAKYSCECGYSIEVVERYPLINQAN